MSRTGAYLARMLHLLRTGDAAGVAHRLRRFAGRRAPVPRPDVAVLAAAYRHSAATPAPCAHRGRHEHLLAFSHNLEREGASISLLDLLLGLLGRDRELTAELVSFADGPLADEYRRAGVRVTVIDPGLADLSTVARLDAKVAELTDLVVASGATVVLANTLISFPAVLAAARAGCRSVWVPRESEPWDRYFDFLPDPVAQRAIAAVALPDTVVFVAEATRRVWDEFESDGHFTVIHNALRAERYRGLGDAAFRAASRRRLAVAEDDFVVLCVGTVCERKGQQDLLDALGCLPAGAPAGRFRVMLVGEHGSAYARRLRGRCSAGAGTNPGRVDFLPPTAEISDYYAAADVFVLSSRVESHPRVILEAMAFGLPVVTTRAFGVCEQVVEGRGARYYEAGDAATLAVALADLQREPAQRRAMGVASAARFAELETFDEMVARYRAVLWPGRHEACR